MKQTILFSVLTILLVACGSKNEDAVSVHTRIEQYEDSIRQWGGGSGTKEDISSFADDYINTLLEAYEEEPDNPKNPEYLDRVQMWYSTVGNAPSALKWALVVEEKYPKYPNRQMLLESIAALYDNGITPRDSIKVREYYTQILKEFPTMPESKKQEINDRLKHNNLTMQEYMQIQE
ncbi:MAG: hypothetical protein KF704_11960 [Crocinitomicaceae bacterium]|nr:hypothetical protein [Crocinitomicaceae bacterium]